MRKKNIRTAPFKIVIEKNIPIPTARKSFYAEAMDKMQIKDSFKFDYKESPKLYHARKKLKLKKFIIRKINQTEGRCWRTK